MDSGDERYLQTDNTSIVVVYLHPFSMYQIIITAETIGLSNFSIPVSFQMPEASKFPETLSALDLSLI